MARPPILTLSDIALTFGGNPVFEGLNLAIQPGARSALVGRNGSGKSTLMKVIAGLVAADSGDRFVQPGAHVAYMEQDPEVTAFPTLGDFALDGFGPSDSYKIEMALEGLKLDGDREAGKASGGERRRAALARLIATEADLMLLDEPTNHLDIEAILWLETWLKETKRAFLLISHDRAFLSALTTSLIWVDRGEVRQQARGFDRFEEWRDKVFDEEDLQRHKRDRLIKAEARWAVEGISARRKRNMGRVRRLQDLRSERAAEISRSGTSAMALEQSRKSGKLVIEAEGVSLAFGDTPIVEDFSLKVMRGDRIALVGPNGVGKTSLLKILTGETQPDTGRLRLGTNLDLAVFDQNRDGLDQDLSLWDSLAQDPELGVQGKNDQIMVRGSPRHVVGYLKDFLFADAQVRQPVRALSGGEKARLLLARIMAKPSNLLVLDEPTNDLDVETLDLLQDILADYPGTVLLVSHDRDFVDRVVTTTIAMEGRGRTIVHTGGYSDYLARKAPAPALAEKSTEKKTRQGAGAASDTPKTEPADAAKSGLSFTEQHRLDALPDEMAKLEAEIAKLEAFLADPDIFIKEPKKFEKATAALVERQTALATAEEDWLMLAEKADS